MNEDLKVLAVNVGRAQTFQAEPESDHEASRGPGRPWESAIIKRPINGSVMVRQMGVDGDDQVDRDNHGGIDKAVLAYSNENYAVWQNEFPSVEWLAGSFGENLTLGGLLEGDVCIGDVHRCGDCMLQVSQPRQPCWKLSKRWKLSKLAVRVQQTRRTGWYYRVLKEGAIEPGQTMVLEERKLPNWTVLAANEIMYGKPVDPDASRELADCSLLSQSWRTTLARRVKRDHD